MKLAILDDYQNVALTSADWSPLQNQCQITVFDHHLGEQHTIVEKLKDFSIICCMRERTPFPKSLINQLPNLKLLVTTGKQNAAIDLEAASECGVIVCGTQSPGHAAAELAWALLMSIAKNLHIENETIRRGEWQTTIGSDLKGQTLGIIGLGRHGENIARFAQAFGMNCIAWSQNLTQQKCEELGVQYVDKKTLLSSADMISIHLKMGQRNRNLIDEEAFALMQPNAILINTSRGPIIDEQAMLNALSEGKLLGVGLDVYDTEPLPKDHPLLTSDRVLLSPHTGYVTKQTYEIFYGQSVEAVSAWLEGKPIRVIA